MKIPYKYHSMDTGHYSSCLLHSVDSEQEIVKSYVGLIKCGNNDNSYLILQYMLWSMSILERIKSKSRVISIKWTSIKFLKIDVYLAQWYIFRIQFFRSNSIELKWIFIVHLKGEKLKRKYHFNCKKIISSHSSR